jgi:hypothetical protein
MRLYELVNQQAERDGILVILANTFVTQNEVNRVRVDILFKSRIAHIAVLVYVPRAIEHDREYILQVLDEQCPSKLVFVSVLRSAGIGCTEKLRVAEEDDVKVASSLAQLAQEVLDGPDSVQELEVICPRV